eukprot:7162565-Ditylum_brightwellii.AAC.1
MQETIKALKSECSAVKKALSKAKKKQCENNKNIADIQALLGDIMAKQALKAIINAEGMSNMLEKIKFADNGTSNSSITLIQVQVS